MRILLIAGAMALAAATSAAAQTKGYAPYTQQAGDPSHIQATRGATMPGPATQPGMATARLGPYRGRAMRHRGPSLRVCMARAGAKGLHGRAKTRFIHYCQIGRR